MQVFFVCGSPKSGTTWLQRVLDAHPEVSCSGEGHFIDRISGPFAQVLRDYNKHLSLVADRVYEGRPYYDPVTQDEFDQIMRHLILGRLLARRAAPQVRWIGDKTPRYAQRLPQLLRIFPEARVIDITRDPRDVIVSQLGVAVRAGTPFTGEKRDGLIRAGAADWLKNVECVQAFAQAHPGRVCQLRYEDLIADATGETRRMFDFLGVASDSGTLQAILRQTSFEAMSGRQPGVEDARSFLRKGVVGDWRSALDAEEARMIADTCAPLMEARGYACAPQAMAAE